MLAKDIMTTNVVTITPEVSVEEIAKLLLARGISGVPMVSAEGALAGLVSEGDLIRREGAPDRGRGNRRRARGQRPPRLAPALHARDLKPVASNRPDGVGGAAYDPMRNFTAPFGTLPHSDVT